MKYSRFLLAAAMMGFMLPAAAHAADNDLLSFSAGDTGIFHNDNALDLRAEYHWSTPLIWQVKPFAGVEGDFKGGFYANAGVAWDWAVAPHWYITPGVAAGLYASGRNLGGPIQFRPQIEGSYEFDNYDRVGLAYSHTSNWGLDNRDPGTDAITMSYQIPISRIAGLLNR